MLHYFCIYVLQLCILITISESKNSEKCSCGTIVYEGYSDFIINGKPVADLKKFPWLVSIHMKEVNTGWGFCGGAIISSTFVLTAAHCLFAWDAPLSCYTTTEESCYAPPKNLRIGLLGNNSEGPGQKVEISAIIPHFSYNKKFSNDDIALLKLKEPLPCTAYVRPICITDKDITPQNTKLRVAGWGRMDPMGMLRSDILREGVVSTIESKICEKPGITKAENLLCTVGTENQSSCQGDSGTAIFFRYKRRYYAVGITSTHSSIPECAPTSPVTFTKIAAYYSFIKKHVQDLPAN